MYTYKEVDADTAGCKDIQGGPKAMGTNAIIYFLNQNFSI